MSLSKSRELRQKHAKMLAEAEAMLPTSGTMTAEVRTAFDAKMKEADEIKGDIARFEQMEAASDELRAVRPPEQNIENRADGRSAELRAYDTYLRRGLDAVQKNPELRTYVPLTSSTEGGGQFLVPVATANEIEKKAKSVGAMLTIVRPVPTNTGELINWPTADDTANNGTFLADDNTTINQTNPTFAHVPVSAFQWSSDEVLVPLALLNDSQFDIPGLLTDEFGERYGRGVNNRITVGTDGILTVSGVGNIPAASASIVSYTEPLTLQGQIDLSYDVKATYMMNKHTYLKYRALTSTTGQLLWPAEEYKAGTLHGRPFIINQDMPDVGVNAKYLIYGDFSKYLVRTVGSFSVFRNPYSNMKQLQHSFQAFQRVAGKCIQPAAFATITAPAS